MDVVPAVPLVVLILGCVIATSFVAIGIVFTLTNDRTSPGSKGGILLRVFCGLLGVALLLIGLSVFGFQKVQVDGNRAFVQSISGPAAFAERQFPSVVGNDFMGLDSSPNWLIVFTVIAIVGVIVLLRKAEAWTFWKTHWKPAGAVTAAAVMAISGGLFAWKWPLPERVIQDHQTPQFVEFLESQFGNGKGNSGYKDLVKMASDPELDKQTARSDRYELIGRLPYGRPTEANETYSENYIFTAGRTGKNDDGLWTPLLNNDEVYRVSRVTEHDQVVFDFGEVPVSHEVEESIPDHALVSLGDPVPVTLSAMASGRFTTVDDAWSDLVSRVTKRARGDIDESTDALTRVAAIRGLKAAATRLAVSRSPLILGATDGTSGKASDSSPSAADELVQPMYRVHVAIAEARWSDAVNSVERLADGPRRDRAMILIAALALTTLIVGGIGRQTNNPRV